MSKPDPEKSRVRPIEDRPSEPADGRSRWAATAGAVLAGIGAVLVIVVASSPDSDSTIALSSSTTAALAPSTTVMTEPETTAISKDEPTLRDFIPGTDGTLVAATGQGGIALTDWPADGPRHNQVIPMHTGPFLDFDVSGQQLAFLGSSAISGGRTLYVGSLTTWAAADAATSYRWHETEPGRIAWMTQGASPELCHAVVDSEQELSDLTCTDAPGDLLAGYDQFGYLMLADGKVLRLDASGALVGGVPGVEAVIGPDGRVLIVNYDSLADQTLFSLAGPELDDVAPLDWAPANAMGEYGFVSWSPAAAKPELAFLVYLGDERWQLQRWSIEGETLSALDLRGRFWDVGWDSTGRYLLVPGVTDSDHVVVVHDLVGREVTYIPFTGWVQDVELVTRGG